MTGFYNSRGLTISGTDLIICGIMRYCMSVWLARYLCAGKHPEH